MSTCEDCSKPGFCCRSFILSEGFAECSTVAEAQSRLDSINEINQRSLDAIRRLKMPFRPLMKTTSGGWVWWCPNLSRTTGRCEDYDNRPETCRSFKPKSGPLCYHYEEG